MWKHYLSALFSLGTTQWDVISDIWNGANYLAYKNVTRKFESDWYPDGVPDGCVMDLNNEDIGNRTVKMKCLESDKVWGWSSIGLVQAPMLLGGQVVLLVVVFHLLLKSEMCGSTKVLSRCVTVVVGVLFLILLFLLSPLTIPFPVIVLAAQIINILNPRHEVFPIGNITDLVIIIVSLEATLEAGPQALLQLYILLSDNEREYELMTKLSFVSSIYTIAKASITMFSSETNLNEEKSLSAGEPSAVVGIYSTVIRFLPVFSTSIIFRIGSSCITLVLLRSKGFISLAIGAVITTVLSAKLGKNSNMVFRIIGSLQHGFGGIAVLASSFVCSRDDDKIPMMISSVVWLITHSMTLLVIAAMVATPQYHLQHWRYTARIPLLAEHNVHILYIIMGILILVGILNVFLVWFQIFNNNWEEVNTKIVQRMILIRGEVQLQEEMPEVGSVEPNLRKVVDKIVESWTSCKTQTLACLKCCTGDIDRKGQEGNVATTQVQIPNFVPVSYGYLEIPANAMAFPVNVFKGETFYLARVNCDGFKIPGYLVPSKKEIFVSWGLKGVAKSLATDVFTDVEVLVESGQRKFYWVDSNKATKDKLKAVGVGTTAKGDTMYVGRAKVDKEWLVGKINPSYDACFIASHKMDMDGRLLELEVKEYEVLCSKPTPALPVRNT